MTNPYLLSECQLQHTEDEAVAETLLRAATLIDEPLLRKHIERVCDALLDSEDDGGFFVLDDESEAP